MGKHSFFAVFVLRCCFAERRWSPPAVVVLHSIVWRFFRIVSTTHAVKQRYYQCSKNYAKKLRTNLTYSIDIIPESTFIYAIHCTYNQSNQSAQG